MKSRSDEKNVGGSSDSFRSLSCLFFPNNLSLQTLLVSLSSESGEKFLTKTSASKGKCVIRRKTRETALVWVECMTNLIIDAGLVCEAAHVCVLVSCCRDVEKKKNHILGFLLVSFYHLVAIFMAEFYLSKRNSVAGGDPMIAEDDRSFSSQKSCVH